MTFEEFDKAGSHELRAEAKTCFENDLGMTGSWDRRAARLIEAQFYMQELDRRDEDKERQHSRRIEKRDLLLEVWVIALICGEIILSVVGIWLAIKQGNDDDTLMEKQTAVLEGLSKSMNTTLETMKSVNDRMAVEIARSAQGQLSFSIDVPRRTIILSNHTNFDVTVWGYQLESRQPVLEKQPVPVARGGSAELPGDALMAEARASKKESLGLTFLVKDDIGNEFVTEGLIVNIMPNGSVGGGETNPFTRAKKWSEDSKR